MSCIDLLKPRPIIKLKLNLWLLHTPMISATYEMQCHFCSFLSLLSHCEANKKKNLRKLKASKTTKRWLVERYNKLQITIIDRSFSLSLCCMYIFLLWKCIVCAGRATYFSYKEMRIELVFVFLFNEENEKKMKKKTTNRSKREVSKNAKMHLQWHSKNVLIN